LSDPLLTPSENVVIMDEAQLRMMVEYGKVILDTMNDSVERIPEEAHWEEGENFEQSARFAYFSFVNQTIKEESEKWLRAYHFIE